MTILELLKQMEQNYDCWKCLRYWNYCNFGTIETSPFVRLPRSYYTHAFNIPFSQIFLLISYNLTQLHLSRDTSTYYKHSHSTAPFLWHSPSYQTLSLNHSFSEMFSLIPNSHLTTISLFWDILANTKRPHTKIPFPRNSHSYQTLLITNCPTRNLTDARTTRCFSLFQTHVSKFLDHACAVGVD